jgi:hypothetical protein
MAYSLDLAPFPPRKDEMVTLLPEGKWFSGNTDISAPAAEGQSCINNAAEFLC